MQLELGKMKTTTEHQLLLPFDKPFYVEVVTCEQIVQWVKKHARWHRGRYNDWMFVQFRRKTYRASTPHKLVNKIIKDVIK